MTVLLALALGAALLAAGGVLGRRAACPRAEAWAAGVRRVADAIRAAAVAESAEVLRSAEIAAREEALATGAAFDAACAAREAELASAQGRLRRRESDVAAHESELGARRE